MIFIRGAILSSYNLLRDIVSLMKRVIIRNFKAFTLSLLLHLSLLFLLFYSFKQEIPIKKPSSQQKFTLNLRDIHFEKSQPKSVLSPLLKKTPTPPKKPKKVNTVPKKKIAFKKPLITKKITPKKIKKLKKIVKKKRLVKKRVKRQKVHKEAKRGHNTSLANALLSAGENFSSPYMHTPQTTSLKRIKRLYGREFNSYTPTQRKFIRENLSTIHKITQQTLTRNGYPLIAQQTGQQGVNIVSFYLQPNGDITHLSIKKSSRYITLDKNTLKVIQIAYKDYPLPHQKTKIIFNVEYFLY